MVMVYVQRKSDGAYFREFRKGYCDFAKSGGTVVAMKRDVAEMWCRHAKQPIRLVGVRA